MIGSCDCKSLLRNPDQSWGDTTRMRWEYRYALNGTVIQDITWKDDDTYTSSIRQWNADSAKWYVTFFSSGFATPAPPTWTGGMKGENLVLYKDQTAPNGVAGDYRITFENISEKGFDWRGEWVDKNEQFTFPTWLIWCTKTRR